MDRIRNFFIKPLDFTAIFSQAALPRFVWEHLLMVYCTLFYTSAFALMGAFGHLFFNIGGLITALEIVPCLWLMSKINPWREFRRVVLLVVAAFLFGATIGPSINLIIEIEQRLIIKIIMGGVVFFSCHLGAILYSHQRNFIYLNSEFSSPILITAWMAIPLTDSVILPHTVLFLLLLPFQWYVVICLLQYFKIRFSEPIHLLWLVFLRYFFGYPVLHLVLVYVIVWSLLIQMKIHSQETIFLATREENYYVNTTLTFYTEFISRTISFHIQIVYFIVGKFRGVHSRAAFMIRIVIVIVIMIMIVIAIVIVAVIVRSLSEEIIMSEESVSYDV